MKILADHNIKNVEDAFGPISDLMLMPGREIHARHLKDCQCLVTRTITRVDENLLRDTPVEYVATATIGTDHIDLDYLREHGIGVGNSAGCNAEAVAEFVIAGLFALAGQRGFDPFQRKAGVIGYGNVGGRLTQKLEALGLETLVCDPPLQDQGSHKREFVSLSRILDECDLISLHVPLTQTGEHPTYHLLDAARLESLNPDCMLVNTARGEVVDNHALSRLLDRRDDLIVFLDTWESEPLPLRRLLRQVDLATPHIAGYSIEGRLRGTTMALDNVCRHFGIGDKPDLTTLFPRSREINLTLQDSINNSLRDLLRQHFDIWIEHRAWLDGLDLDDEAFALLFDRRRRENSYRVEYGAISVGGKLDDSLRSLLAEMGFRRS